MSWARESAEVLSLRHPGLAHAVIDTFVLSQAPSGTRSICITKGRFRKS
jgi:hypothetical protein